MPTNVTYTLHDVNEDSQGIYAAVMIPTGTGVEAGPEGQGRDEVAVVILRKFPLNPRLQVIRRVVGICGFSSRRGHAIRWNNSVGVYWVFTTHNRQEEHRDALQIYDAHVSCAVKVIYATKINSA